MSARVLEFYAMRARYQRANEIMMDFFTNPSHPEAVEALNVIAAIERTYTLYDRLLVERDLLRSMGYGDTPNEKPQVGWVPVHVLGRVFRESSLHAG